LLDSRDTVELGDVVLKFIRAGEVYRLEADESRQLVLAAKPSDSLGGGKRVLSRPARIGASVLVLGAAGVMGVVALAVHYRSGTGHGTVSERGDRASRIFALAVRQFDEGQVAAAHETASELPADSNARQSREFRRIEAAWADMMFRRSAQERDLAKARELLDRVAKTPSVDTVRRRRAADQIAELDTTALDVTQLPQQTAQAEQPSATPARVEPVKASGGPRIHPEAPSAGAAPESGRAKVALSAKASPKAAVSAKTSPTVAPKMVASGNLAQLTAAKESLKAKVRSGAATPQDMKLLSALCRQLGDTSCAQ